MTLDTSDWKINDPEWVKQREEKWPIFEEWLYRLYSSLDGALVSESMLNAKIFYDTGVLNKDVEGLPGRVGLERVFVLAPSLNSNYFKELRKFYYLYGNRKDLKGSFHQYYLGYSENKELIGKVLPSDFMLQLLRSAYGNSLTEAAKILEFDVEKVCLGLFKNLSDKILLYYVFGNSSFNGDVARFMLPFYLETITWLKDEDEQECDFYFNTMIEIKKEEYDLNTVSDINRVEFMKYFLEAIEKNLVNTRPWVQQKLSPLFDRK
ncbi:MAG: hypothetical protein IPK77_08690 [Cellvibrio sp.]|nr:hypothetical protein [Cellvibrio sp.]